MITLKCTLQILSAQYQVFILTQQGQGETAISELPVYFGGKINIYKGPKRTHELLSY